MAESHSKESSEQLDHVESLLLHMLYGDLQRPTDAPIDRARLGDTFDGGLKLKFPTMRPRMAYSFQPLSDDRLFTLSPDMLLSPIQETLGATTEVAIFRDDRVRWIGFRKTAKVPRGVWVGAAGACVYEVHQRDIYADGRSTYQVRPAAISKSGRPVPVAIMGTSGAGALADSENLVMAASIIEDAHRSDALTATVSSNVALRFPVPIGDHKELFAMRDAPLTADGRRKAIIHWVAKHARATRRGRTEVRAHWRGARSVTVEGLTVELSTNEP